jgi:hypothetical protein
MAAICLCHFIPLGMSENQEYILFQIGKLPEIFVRQRCLTGTIS